MKRSIKSRSFDFLTFVALIAIDYSLSWTTSDLVWSFWLSSITVGYLVIVTSALKIPLSLNALLSHKDAVQTQNITKKQVLIGSVFISIFLIGFFSVHFLGFHIGHSSFLKSAFPLEGFSARSSGLIDLNYLLALFKVLIPLYWPMVLVSLFNKRELLLPARPEKDMQKLFKSFGLGPYQNVIKIHFLIFILFGLKEAGIDKMITHLVVLLIFSINFPMPRIGKKRSAKRSPRKKVPSSS